MNLSSPGTMLTFVPGPVVILIADATKQVFPDVYNWVTFPITTLMEAVWVHKLKTPVEQCKNLAELQRVEDRSSTRTGTKSSAAKTPRSTRMPWLSRLANAPSPQYVELIAVLERAYNFAHTGAAKVIVRGLMNRLWIGRAIVDGLMPFFLPALKFIGPDLLQPELSMSVWPIDKKTNRPLVASKRAQELTYGSQHFMVSTSAVSN